MIVWNKKIKVADSVFKAVDFALKEKNIDVDGVVDYFNNGKEQGALLKIFDKYNPEIDICIWAYLPAERDCHNQMEVLIGLHKDCTDNNLWSSVVSTKVITQNRVLDLKYEVRDYIVNTIISRLDKMYEIKK